MTHATFDPARRRFLRGRLQAPVPVHPPWARAAHLTDLCVRCGRCSDACPERIIVLRDGGFPEVDFTRGECTFCGACASACPEPVFDRDVPRPWSLTVTIGTACLAARGVVCRTCRDACPESVIVFDLAAGRVARPRVAPEMCTGCGACVGACPAEAIAITPVSGAYNGA